MPHYLNYITVSGPDRVQGAVSELQVGHPFPCLSKYLYLTVNIGERYILSATLGITEASMPTGCPPLPPPPPSVGSNPHTETTWCNRVPTLIFKCFYRKHFFVNDAWQSIILIKAGLNLIIYLKLEVTAASKVLRVVIIYYLLIKYLRPLEVKLCGTLLRNVMKLLKLYTTNRLSIYTERSLLYFKFLPNSNSSFKGAVHS